MVVTQMTPHQILKADLACGREQNPPKGSSRICSGESGPLQGG